MDRRTDDLLPLARAAAHRDADAAATLVSQVGGLMLSTVRQVLGRDHPDTDDVVQEAVLAFLDSLVDFRGDCTTRRYAQRIALFSALSARRRLVARQRAVELQDDRELDAVASGPQASPHWQALASRRRAVLRKLLDSLPDVIAEALALHFICGYTVEEIAVACSAPANTIWSRLRLGKQALRKMLRENQSLADLFEVHE